MRRPDQTTEPFTVDLPLAGKTVARAYQESGDFHSLDEGYAQDGAVILEFTDESKMSVVGCWCNDGTGATDVEIED